MGIGVSHQISVILLNIFLEMNFMSEARYTKNGLLIPANWLKPMGSKVRVRRSGNVLIIESQEREAARKRLARIVKSLRKAGRKIGVLTTNEIDTLVKDVRKARAGYR